MAGSFKSIDHPADTGIEVWADSLAELFEYSAKGLIATGVAEPNKIETKEKRAIKVKGDDLKELMVNFLSEFLYFIDTESLVFSKIEIIRIAKNESYELEAKVWGGKFNSDIHGSLTDIKAITYHQMEIEEKDGKWQARMIFDI